MKNFTKSSSVRLAAAQAAFYARHLGRALYAWDTRTGSQLLCTDSPRRYWVMTYFLVHTAHFDVWSPGYLYVQQLYKNPETGCEEWGPLTTAKLHSTTWLLATVHVYLWVDVLRNQQFATDRFTTARRDLIIEKQQKIMILLKQILRKTVPGFTPAQNESAFRSLHDFMNTNPDLPFEM
ncbi:hypothetical protein BU15DRAFT_65558 [Melanogaster broomeanus]|nr:hypothetical protein BU15DRAFT_65558 [Melanogaster broomeanus]